MRHVIFAIILIISTASAFAVEYRTYLKPTSQTFENGEVVYQIEFDQSVVGEWWPIKNGLDFVTKETHPKLFQLPLEKMMNEVGAVAMVPDGMTSALASTYLLEGKAIVDGILVNGDGTYPNYGIMLLENKGTEITFTHKSEIVTSSNPDEQNVEMDQFFSEHLQPGTTVFFLPSIQRNQNSLKSSNVLERAIVRRLTPTGIQIGMVILQRPMTYHQIIEICAGLDRPGASSTTHIYYTDGGPSWGQVAKKVNDRAQVMGNRTQDVVTNYMVIY
jgi:hypothetical protein